MSPSPGPGLPTPPREGVAIAVRWRTRQGDTESRLFRQRPAAARFADYLRSRGADPALYTTRLAAWRAIDPDPEENP